MRRIAVISACLLAAAPGFSFGFDASAGVSIYIPESLYEHGQGSISVETDVQYSFELSKYLSVPVGVSYDKIFGLEAANPVETPQPQSPWFFADSVMPYAELKVHLPVGPFYGDLFGGLAANWYATLTPIGQNIESYLAAQKGPGTIISFTNPVVAPGVGLGWVAGGDLGVDLGKMKLDVSFTYRDVSQPLGLSGSYYENGSTAPNGLDASWASEATLVMRGISIGVNGTVSF